MFWLFLFQVMLDWLVRACGLPEKFLWHQPDPNSSSDGNGSSSAGSIGGSSSSREGSGRKRPGGVIQNSSSEAVLVAMLAARARALSGRPCEAALQLVAYGTDQVWCLCI